MALKRKVEDLNVTIEELKTKNEELNNSLKRKEIEAKQDKESLRLKVEKMETDAKEVANKKMQFINKLKDKIECPVCYEIPRSGPVFVCPNGHIVCSGCKRDICPSCRAHMGKVKSLLAETIIENIQHQCKYADCEEYFDLDRVEGHEEACAHRIVNCPEVLCKEKVPLSKLLGHLVRGTCVGGYKPDSFENLQSRRFNFVDYYSYSIESWPLKLFDFEGATFAFIPHRFEDIYCFPCVMLGTEEDCSKFKVNLEVFERSANSSEESRSYFKFSGTPCSIDDVKALVRYDGLTVSRVRMMKIFKIHSDNESNENSGSDEDENSGRKFPFRYEEDKYNSFSLYVSISRN